MSEHLAQSPEEANARDRALLELLQHGPASFERLMTVVPGTLAPWAREKATRASVLRLKVKKHIRIVPEGYAIA